MHGIGVDRRQKATAPTEKSRSRQRLCGNWSLKECSGRTVVEREQRVVTPSACAAQFSGSFAREFAWKSGTRKRMASPLHIEPTDSEGTQYRVVEFTDVHGIKHQRKLNQWTSDDPPLGKPMTLVYDPDNPSTVSGGSVHQMWMAPGICCVLGGIGVLIGIVSLPARK